MRLTKDEKKMEKAAIFVGNKIRKTIANDLMKCDPSMRNNTPYCKRCVFFFGCGSDFFLPINFDKVGLIAILSYLEYNLGRRKLDKWQSKANESDISQVDSGASNGIEVMDESGPISEEVFLKLGDYETPDDMNGKIVESKSMAKRVAAQKPTKVIKTVDIGHSY